MTNGVETTRTVLIIQARMASSRLPGKSMMDLAGGPLVGRILERVQRCRRISEIVVATTGRTEDDVLVEMAARYGVATFRGSADDVLDRYHRAAAAFGAEVVVRLPGDNPVPEPGEIDRIVDYHAAGGSDFSSNLAEVFGNGYPDGIGAEVFDYSVLDEVSHTSTEPEWREHVHLNFFDYRLQQPTQPDRFSVGTVTCPAAFRRPDLVLDVNTPADYEFMAALYRDLYDRDPHFNICDIISWYDERFGGVSLARSG